VHDYLQTNSKDEAQILISESEDGQTQEPNLTADNTDSTDLR